MSDSNLIRYGGEFLLYTTEDGQTRLQVRLQNETVWLSLNQLAELFQRDKSVISRHIRNIFEEGELRPEATVAKFATVQVEGNREVTRNIEFYNLDVIISAGYRVKSHRGTQFRIWATQRLREYIIKGFTRLNMGLTNWIGDTIRKTETSIAKNYLTEEELDVLNRIVTMYLEFAELQALNRKPMYMRDWIVKLDILSARHSKLDKIYQSTIKMLK